MFFEKYFKKIFILVEKLQKKILFRCFQVPCGNGQSIKHSDLAFR